MRKLLTVLLLAAMLGSPGTFAFTRTLQPDAAERQELYTEGTRVLIIGVSRYRDPGWPGLNGHRDAERIRRLFMERGVADSAITLVEPDPDRGPDLQTALVRFGETLPPDSAARVHVIVYIASHGFTSDGLGYLVPPNAPDPALQPVAFKLAALPLPTLLARAATFRAAHVLLIIDACFSGLALESLPRERFPHPPGAGSEREPKVLQVITAGTAGQTVADDGLFAELVGAGLTGAADLNFDGWISGTELGMYLRLRMTESSQRRQTPSFGNILGLSAKYAEGENWFASPQLTLQSATSRVQPLERGNSAFRDCEDCPLLRVVPAPSAAGEPAASAYLAMGVREVSFDEFDACFRAAGCAHWPWSASGERGRLPVTDVSWRDATEYTHWLTCVTGSRYRMPTDAEWLAVAQPERDRLMRSWASPGSVLANCRGCGSRWDARSPAPTGSFPPSELGLYDLIGNAWEWTGDCPAPGRDGELCTQTTVRGGAFTTRRSVTVALPGERLLPSTRDRNIGFRVVRELEGAPLSARGSCEAAPATP
jgi:Sulfatase-modifying factor enzyme 1/Caspase domain